MSDPGMTAPVRPGRGRLVPVDLGDVRLTGGFWADRQRVNAEATLDHCLHWIERLGWLGNFDAAAEGRLPAGRMGREFSDSEIYKLSEAMAWELARGGNRGLETILDRVAVTLDRAQEVDGYLNTAFGRPGQSARYSDLEWGHELYCYGHLIQAGVASARSSGAGAMLDVAVRAADHVCSEFGATGIDGVCGHPGIEMALVELARLTGEQRYLDQAALFVDRRGHGRLADIEFGRGYYQDDVPVRDARVFGGHAVRALYLASGAVDLAVETGDDDLLAAVVAQWEATVARRTYLTGGMGAQHAGEAFGDDFALPPDRAYSETCAAVASVMLSWRLLLATGDPRYADLAERTLYNVVATSPAADGRAFFYANTLHKRIRSRVPPADRPSPRAQPGMRAPWFAVSCCPTNVARLLASLSAYVATVDAGGVQLHQYADADISTRLADGRAVGVEVRTGYPDSGAVTVTVTDPPPGEATVSLRVPHWARGAAKLTDPDGRVRPATAAAVEIRRAFASGDVIRLELPVGPRFTSPAPRIDAIRGSVAVERGPVVLCVESIDLPGEADVDVVRIDPAYEPEVRGNAVVAEGALVEPGDGAWPYGSGRIGPAASRTAEITLRPYHSWAERGPSTMRVWTPTT
jgi:uncharacterized protein